MLTDTQIEELAKRMSVPLEGCYFKDELPKIIKPNRTYIINIQDSEDDNGNQNEGTHWTMLQVQETPNGTVKPIYFDPYGQPPPEQCKKSVQKTFKKHLPHTTKDIQSLMNNACGFYCLALAHFINAFRERTGDIYKDVDDFIDLFDDLNHSIDWKKNEHILKMFFQSEDPARRNKGKNVYEYTHDDYDRILNEDAPGGGDLTKIPVHINDMKK